MSVIKLNMCLLLAIIAITISPRCVTAETCSLEISTSKPQIKFGDSLFVDLIFRLDKPPISKKTQDIRKFKKLDGLMFNVSAVDGSEPSIISAGLPVMLELHDANNLEYRTRIQVFCKVYEERNQLKKVLVFPEPGRYNFSITKRRELKSNNITVTVLTSKKGSRAISLLDDPKDMAFLHYGFGNRPDRISLLEEIIEQCDGTQLAGRASARLALITFKGLRAKYPDPRYFIKHYREGKITEPLIDKAQKHLAKALALPNEHAILDEVLYNAASLEMLKSDYKKALFYAKQLSDRCPNGKHGRKVSKIIENISMLELNAKDNK